MMNRAPMPFSQDDVLSLAAEIIRADENDGDEDGPGCPWCAVGAAKTRLDRKHGSGNVDPLVALTDVLLGTFTTQPTDWPLDDARERLKEIIPKERRNSDEPYSKDEGLRFLEKARSVGGQPVLPARGV